MHKNRTIHPQSMGLSNLYGVKLCLIFEMIMIKLCDKMETNETDTA